MATLSEAIALQLKVVDRENLIRDLLRAAKIPGDEITLMAMLGIIHLTMADAALDAADTKKAFDMACDIVELKKKGVM